VEAPQIGKAQKVGTVGLTVKRKDGPLNRRVTMGAVLGLLNIYCTHWKNGQPLPNGLVEDELYGRSKEKLNPYFNTNGRYTNQFFEMILENHSIPYMYTNSLNKPFVFFLETCLTSSTKPRLNTPLSSILSPDLVSHINKFGILILYDSEGYKTHSLIMYNELKSIGLDYSRVICLSASKQIDTRLTSFFIAHLGEELFNSFLRDRGKTIKMLKEVKNTSLHKKFTCLIGRGDSSHKALLAKRMYQKGFIKDSHFSLTLFHRKSYKKLVPSSLLDSMPITAEPRANSLEIAFDRQKTQHAHIKLASESYINIVPTSTYRLEKNFSPESRLPNDLFISIITRRPFLIVSNFPNYLQTVKKLGYKTFDGIIDESYDRELNLQKRLDMVMNELDRLKTLDLDLLLDDCSDIMKHNLKVFMTKRTSQPFVDYLQSLSLYT
jgi:hypothetical protein